MVEKCIFECGSEALKGYYVGSASKTIIASKWQSSS